jgi:hypothetical protein
MGKRDSSKQGSRRDARMNRRTRIEAQRHALLQRLACLHPATKASPGYRSAEVLLTSRYVRSKLAARLGILQAAHFMIKVLEMTPPS